MSIPNTTMPMRLSSRKRAHSTAETIILPMAIDTKRMRLGIQELSTNPPSEHLQLQANPHFSIISTTNEPSDSESESSSSSLDSEESTSSSDEISGSGVDEGYDSDTESGSTTTSSSSSSSEEESGRDDGEMRTARSAYVMPAMSLAEKLSSFLPRLAAANAELDDARAAGRLVDRNMEDVQDGAVHIEMRLGLGVLEEKRGVAFDDGSDNDGDESEGEEASVVSETSARSRNGDAMAFLMGKKTRRKPGIQVVDTTTRHER